MVCSKCGCEQVGAARFCRQCGMQLQGAVAQPPYEQAGYGMPNRRVQRNVQALGVLWCVFGIYRMVSVLVGAAVLQSLAFAGVFRDTPPFVGLLLHAFMPAILLLSVLWSGLAILAGVALLSRKPWARVLTIVLGVLSLLKFPFGTALGIYTLWVLAPQASAAEWETMAPSMPVSYRTI
jgi:hypothetical protein